MAKTVKAQLKCRHDTAANWTAKNPVLLDGELGVETDTTFFKIGDGATAWTSLKYVTSKSAVYDNSGNVIADTYAKKTEVSHEEYNAMTDMIASYTALKGANGYIERIAKEYTEAPVADALH